MVSLAADLTPYIARGLSVCAAQIRSLMLDTQAPSLTLLDFANLEELRPVALVLSSQFSFPDGIRSFSHPCLEGVLQFWPRSHSLFSPGCINSLRALEVKSKVLIGLHPVARYLKVHFPSLETLSLSGHVLVDPGSPARQPSVLSFILSHKKTLASLVLEDCVIDKTSSIRWADVCHSLRAEVLRLQHFVIAWEEGEPHYVTYESSGAHGFIPWREAVVSEEDKARDDLATEQLCNWSKR